MTLSFVMSSGAAVFEENFWGPRRFKNKNDRRETCVTLVVVDQVGAGREGDINQLWALNADLLENIVRRRLRRLV
jgi:hypothetical protein